MDSSSKVIATTLGREGQSLIVERRVSERGVAFIWHASVMCPHPVCGIATRSFALPVDRICLKPRISCAEGQVSNSTSSFFWGLRCPLVAAALKWKEVEKQKSSPTFSPLKWTRLLAVCSCACESIRPLRLGRKVRRGELSVEDGCWMDGFVARGL